MRREIEFIASDASVQSAAQLMGEIGVGALAVGTRESLQGVLTDRDILLRVVAQALDAAATRVSEAMSAKIFSCRETDTLEKVLQEMALHDVRRLPVLDAHDHVTGWITSAAVWQRLVREGLAVPARLEEFAGLAQ